MPAHRLDVTAFSVLFQPSGHTVTVESGLNLFLAAERAGVAIQNVCHGEGFCMQCRVQVVRGAAPPDAAALAFLSPDELAAGFVIACRTPVRDDLEVFVNQPFEVS